LFDIEKNILSLQLELKLELVIIKTISLKKIFMSSIALVKFSEKLSESLLQINAVKINTTNYFTWVSGIQSPIYCDNRQTLVYPKIRKLIYKGFSDYILQTYPEAQYIAGVATGAIAHGALVANALNLPFIYVRPKPKEHGLENQIEGIIDPGKSVVVIEDLISTAQSSINAVEALRKAGFKVLGLVAIFSYEFWKAIDTLSEANCKYSSLTDFHELIKTALKYNYISSEQITILKEWHDNINKNDE